jgi:hypothetical protein
MIYKVMKESFKKDHVTDVLGKQATILGIIEMGLGSFLHSFKVPLAGHCLSLNQIFFLTRASQQLQLKTTGAIISVVTAGMKGLSPAGKRLTPMLAISAQGMLFSFGVTVFGLSWIGYFVGALLASLWGFVQPVLFIYLLYGQTSVEVANYFLKEVNKVISIDFGDVFFFASCLVGIKVIFSLITVICARKISQKRYESYETMLKEKAKLKKIRKDREGESAFLLALRDTLNPLFLFSFILTAVFFIFAESSYVTIIWALMRPLLIAFLLFYIARVYPIEKLGDRFEKMGWLNLAETWRKSVGLIRSYRVS